VSAEAKATRRQRQAEQTRLEIIEAGRRLFASQGYARTSVAEIAGAAGVSVQTIYDSLGSKAAIVRHLNDLIDAEGGVAELASRIPTATDGAALLDIVISISHNINERCDDIVATVYSSAPLEPELAAVRDESRRRHRQGVRGLTGRVAEIGALRDDLAVDEAADIIAAMTDPQVARTFVTAYGWTWSRWHAWVLAALTTMVLRPGI
jgi:AcrR family transcriptional regulator